MHYDGWTHIFMHGTAASLLNMIEFNLWPESRNERPIHYAEDLLIPVEYLRSIPKDQIETIKFDVDTGLDVLDCMDKIANAIPEIEIAIAAEVEFSVTETVGFFSYFSPRGDNSIHPDEFLSNFCGSRMCIPLSGKFHDGSPFQFDLMDVDDKCSDWRVDLEFYPEPEYSVLNSITDCYSGTGIAIVLQHTQNGDWSIIADPYTYNRLRDGFAAIEKEFANEYSLNMLLRVYTDGDFPPYSINFLDKSLQLLCPNYHILINEVGNLLYLSDLEGNEYFLGSMLTPDLDNCGYRVDWGFPKDADWISL